jgi:hypothetical protein
LQSALETKEIEMFYSKTAKQSGANGFFFAGDKNAPSDAVEVSAADVSTAVNLPAGKTYDFDEGGNITISDYVPPAPTAEQIAAAKVALIQRYMDQQAQALHYDDIKTACTYADEPSVPRFQQEGQAFRAWRSLVWATCYDILDQVNAGTRAIPTDDELIAALPILELPT